MGGLLRERICPTFRKNPRHSLTKARVGDSLCLQNSCKRQNREKRPCRTSAKSKMGKSVLAEVLQTPKWGKAPLQKFCKVQNGEKRLCRSLANAKMGKSVLAEVLQTPKWGKVSLQKFCKRQNGEKCPCRSSANAKMEKSVLAEVLQTPKWGKASLQDSCNHFRTPVCGLYGVLFWEVRGKVSVKVWRRSAVKA